MLNAVVRIRSCFVLRVCATALSLGWVVADFGDCVREEALLVRLVSVGLGLAVAGANRLEAVASSCGGL